jgi:hypothetical protein
LATNPIQSNEQAASRDNLEKEFAQIGPGVSPAARAVLEAALSQVSSREFNRALASIPDVGLDSDFERNRD